MKSADVLRGALELCRPLTRPTTIFDISNVDIMDDPLKRQI